MGASGAAGGEPPHEEARLAPTFVGIVVVQILVVLALYWAGRFFGS